MHNMKYIAISLLFLLAAGCKKLNSLTNVNNILQSLGDSIPAATSDIGTPTGTAVSKSIGPSGGSLLSADGRIELIIPSGALSANTNIVIQPVTNNCPGVGESLRPSAQRNEVRSSCHFYLPL